MTTPDRTRIEAAFADLETQGIIARPDFECCNTCASHALDNTELPAWEGTVPAIGAVFFHAQATDSANEGDKLWLGHTSFDGTPGTDRRVARMICETLTNHGFTYDWDGSLSRKIAVNAPGAVWDLDYSRAFEDDEEAYA